MPNRILHGQKTIQKEIRFDAQKVNRPIRLPNQRARWQTQCGHRNVANHEANDEPAILNAIRHDQFGW